jgi:P27 family predicted phage terminase small subunit
VRGRKPKPTAVKELEGNPGKRPLPEEEPHHEAPPPDFDLPPAELTGDLVAAAEWRRLAPVLRKSKTVTEADRGSLIACCQQWSRYLEANKSVSSMGMVVRSPSGYPMPNPYIGITNKALGNLVRLWAELGLTPSSRSRVTAAEDPSDRDAFAEFDAPPITVGRLQ